jgi:hypothetical protein
VSWARGVGHSTRRLMLDERMLDSYYESTFLL